jgi:hypothetical protein
MSADLENLLSIKDALAYLHIGRTTLQRLMKARKIGFVLMPDGEAHAFSARSFSLTIA